MTFSMELTFISAQITLGIFLDLCDYSENFPFIPLTFVHSCQIFIEYIIYAGPRSSCWEGTWDKNREISLFSWVCVLERIYRR